MNAKGMRSITVAVLLVASGILSATAARRDRTANEESQDAGTSVEPPRDSAPAPLDSLAAAIVARNPFRPERGPAPIRYDPHGAAVAQEVPAPRPPRPTFVLRGIVQAEHARAVIEGFPGTNQPMAVQIGQRFGAFLIDEITMSGVTIRGADTTWILKMKVPW